MKLFRITTNKNRTIDLEAKTEAEAKKLAEKLIADNSNVPRGKITDVTPVYVPKPNAETIKRDGGYEFVGWGIHVAAKTEAEAKKLVKQISGVNVDKDNAPDPANLVALQQ
jgi:hypothetical protein